MISHHHRLVVISIIQIIIKFEQFNFVLTDDEDPKLHSECVTLDGRVGLCELQSNCPNGQYNKVFEFENMCYYEGEKVFVLCCELRDRSGYAVTVNNKSLSAPEDLQIRFNDMSEALVEGKPKTIPKIETFSPCEEGFFNMVRIKNGEPDKENDWDGYFYLEQFNSYLDRRARISIKFDAPANLTVENSALKLNKLNDVFHITTHKLDGGYKTAKFHVSGVPGGKFPNLESLLLNGANICPNLKKWKLSDDVKPSQTKTLATQFSSSSSVTECGTRKIQHIGLIINGYPTLEGEWPWHAGIYHQVSSSNFRYKCGGTLISRNAVLTAAHCVVEQNRFLIPNRVLVKLGQHNRIAGGNLQEIPVFRIIPHSEYGFDTLKNDIAILQLAVQPTLNAYVQPVCIWPRNSTSIQEVVGEKGFVVGWGFSKQYQLSDILAQAQMPVVSFTECLDSNRDFFGQYLSDQNFCAGFRNGTSVCNGDSGGGMFFPRNNRFFIRGIVSLSVSQFLDLEQGKQQVCDPKQYMVFTDVAQYIDWIENNLL